MEKNKEKEKKKEGSVSVKAIDDVWNCGTPLYDAYELTSIAYIIDKHMITSQFHREETAPRNKKKKTTTRYSKLFSWICFSNR